MESKEKSASFYFFTFLVHCLTVLTSSEMTMSTHLVQGSLIFPICLFTMVSKAMSGVKRPVLPDTERSSHRAERREEEEEELVERKKRRNKEGWVERRVLIIKIYPPLLSFKQKQAKIQQKTGKGKEPGCDPTQQIFSYCYIVLDQRGRLVTHISHIPTFYNQASQQVFYIVQGLTNVIEHLS